MLCYFVIFSVEFYTPYNDTKLSLIFQLKRSISLTGKLWTDVVAFQRSHRLAVVDVGWRPMLFDHRVKVKVEYTRYIASSWGNLSTEALRYGTRCQGIHTLLSATHESIHKWNDHTCLCLPSRSWSSFTDIGGMETWVGLGTTMVSKQPAYDRYVTEIIVVSCSERHASLGNWSVEATRVEPLTSWATSRDANNRATKSPNYDRSTETPISDDNRTGAKMDWPDWGASTKRWTAESPPDSQLWATEPTRRNVKWP